MIMPGRTAKDQKAHLIPQRIADGVRVLSVLSIAVAAVWFDLPAVLGLTVVTIGLMIPRLCRLAGPFDATFCITILIAAWSGIAGLYRAVSWWDLVVHFVTAGSSAAILYLILARSNIIPTATRHRFPTRSVIILTAALGLTAAVLWEFLEWAGNRYITSRIHVGYNDTLADLAVGGLGAVIAGIALAHWSSRNTSDLQKHRDPKNTTTSGDQRADHHGKDHHETHRIST
jgi:hypothetical protein